MSYLLDTCIISELRKEIPIQVKEWLEDKSFDSFFISVVTIAELLDGIGRLPHSKKKRDLESWFFGDVLTKFEGRILPIDENVAKTWGMLSASLPQKEISIRTQDLYLAATAKIHGLAIITANIKHFKNIEITVLNPWEKVNP